MLALVTRANTASASFIVDGLDFDDTIPLTAFSFDLGDAGTSRPNVATLVSDLAAISAIEAADEWAYEIKIKIVDHLPQTAGAWRLARDDSAASRRSQIKGGGLALDFWNAFNSNFYEINWFSGGDETGGKTPIPITDSITDVNNVSPNEVEVTIQIHRFLDSGIPTLRIFVPVGQAVTPDSPELITTDIEPFGTNIGIGAIVATQPGSLERFTASGSIRGGLLVVNAVPEPSSFALAVAALIGLGTIACRQMRVPSIRLRA
jgi:hypothetical protein